MQALEKQRECLMESIAGLRTRLAEQQAFVEQNETVAAKMRDHFLLEVTEVKPPNPGLAEQTAQRAKDLQFAEDLHAVFKKVLGAHNCPCKHSS